MDIWGASGILDIRVHDSVLRSAKEAIFLPQDETQALVCLENRAQIQQKSRSEQTKRDGKGWIRVSPRGWAEERWPWVKTTGTAAGTAAMGQMLLLNGETNRPAEGKTTGRMKSSPCLDITNE